MQGVIQNRVYFGKVYTKVKCEVRSIANLKVGLVTNVDFSWSNFSSLVNFFFFSFFTENFV